MTNQANSEKHRQERWEDFLDTVFARSKKIEYIEMNSTTAVDLHDYMQNVGYSGLCLGLMDVPPHLWDVSVIWNEDAASPKIVYKEGALSPDPKPRPRRERTVDTWLDDEV